MLNGIKQQVVVGKDGKIEIQTSELIEGTVVDVIVLVEQDEVKPNANPSTYQDATEYLLSTEANRSRLMTAIQDVEAKTNLVSFTPEKWNEEYNICFPSNIWSKLAEGSTVKKGSDKNNISRTLLC